MDKGGENVRSEERNIEHASAATDAAQLTAAARENGSPGREHAVLGDDANVLFGVERAELDVARLPLEKPERMNEDAQPP